MTPIDLLPPAAAISLANPEPAPSEPLQEILAQAETPDDDLARLALFETLARMLSAPGAQPLHEEAAVDPTAALIGLLLDAATKDGVLPQRSILG